MSFSNKKTKNEYITQYQKDNYDRLIILVEKGKKAEYKEIANKKGISLSHFVTECINSYLRKENSNFPQQNCEKLDP